MNATERMMGRVTRELDEMRDEADGDEAAADLGANDWFVRLRGIERYLAKRVERKPTSANRPTLIERTIVRITQEGRYAFATANHADYRNGDQQRWCDRGERCFRAVAYLRKRVARIS